MYNFFVEKMKHIPCRYKFMVFTFYHKKITEYLQFTTELKYSFVRLSLVKKKVNYSFL